MGEFDFFKGRKLLKSDVTQDQRHLLKSKHVVHYPTMKEEEAFIRCLRCNSRHLKQNVTISTTFDAYYYCPTCIQLGRVQSNQSFYHYPDKRRVEIVDAPLEWQGQLSLNQAKASQKISSAINNNRNLLIDAVTGAGKTEMLFAGIAQALQSGKRVCLASPRTDVCLELYPRLQKVFPTVAVSLLYGKQTAAYHYSTLVICTTHQLLRFYQAFDVLVIDEVDAFPYVGNQMLAYGVTQARKKSSSLLYLSATPTKELKKRVAAGALSYHQVPVRFHGKPLPVPQGKWVWQWEQKIKQGKLPRALNQLILQQLSRQRKTLIFCPTIKLAEQLAEVLQAAFPDSRIAVAHARDVERYEKVAVMRERPYDLLLTTTILERGVTFEGIDVIVVGSNHDVFNQAALIQIAGRVGRSSKHATGSVWLIHDGWSQGMRECCQVIRATNQVAEKKGLLN